jgi:hypothetical protein
VSCTNQAFSHPLGVSKANPLPSRKLQIATPLRHPHDDIVGRFIRQSSSLGPGRAIQKGPTPVDLRFSSTKISQLSRPSFAILNASYLVGRLPQWMARRG